MIDRMNCCGDVDCPECGHGMVISIEEEQKYFHFRAGVYHAAALMNWPLDVLSRLAIAEQHQLPGIFMEYYETI